MGREGTGPFPALGMGDHITVGSVAGSAMATLAEPITVDVVSRADAHLER